MNNFQEADVEQLIEPSAFTIGFSVVFLLISIGIGIYASRKAKTAEQFFGGTKSFGPITIALASSAAIMSAFGFIGGPGLVYTFGFSSIWITIACGSAFSYAYWIMGKRMRCMAEITEVATLPDIAYVRFKSEVIRGLLAIGLLIASIAYLSSQVKGGAKLMNQMLGVSENIGVIVLFGTTLIYTTVSGMAGSILTAAFQGFVMILGALGVIIGFFVITGGNAMPVIQSAEQYGPEFVDGIGNAPVHMVITYVAVFFVGLMGQPQMLNRMYSLKNPRDLKQAGIISGLTYAIASLVWILVGYGALYLVASGEHVPLVDADKAAFLFLSKMSEFIKALVMAALLAAIMSTASFFMALATGSITRDLFKVLGHKIPHEQQVKWGRVLTFIVTGLAIAFGYLGGEMVAILGTLGWGFFASVTLPTFTLGLLWKRTSKEAVISGLTVAIVLNLVLVVFQRTNIFVLNFPYYLLSIALAMFVTVIVSFFTDTSGGENLPEEIKPIFTI
ncbi:sodium:solute symporter [Candidatus Latescibacterota bacterium]